MYKFKSDNKLLKKISSEHAITVWVRGITRFLDNPIVKDRNHVESTRNERKNLRTKSEESEQSE